MSRIAVFGMGIASKSPYVTAKKLQNIYAETRPAGEKSTIVGYKTPGLVEFSDTGDDPARALYAFDKNDSAFGVFLNAFVQIGGTGSITNIGFLQTFVGHVSIADNGNQIMLVDGTYGYIYVSSPVVQAISSITRVGTIATLTTASAHGLGTGMQVTISNAAPTQYNGAYTITVTGPTTFTYVMASDPGSSASPVGTYVVTNSFAQITDPDFPVLPMTVAFLAGRFVVNFNQSSRFYWSDPYDGLSWNALSFANAETNPDPIVAIWQSNGQLILFGSRSTEYFGVSGSLDAPYTSITNTATEWGLAATWSVSKYDNSVACLWRNRMGQVMVAKLAGYLPQKISTPDMDTIINSYAVVSDATSYSYMLGGHAMYVINFPSAGFTWLYDGFTQIWTSLKSHNITRHRAEIGLSFLANTIVSDFEDGLLYTLTDTAYTDNGASIESEIISENISTPDLDRFSINKFRVDMQVGMGDSVVENPQVGLSISRDNGKTYGAEMLQDIGPIGNYTNVVEWNRLGTARDFVFKLRMNDAFPFTLVSASVNSGD